MELFLESFWPMFRAGLTVSVPLMLVSFALGLVLAFIIALMRMSKLPPLKGIAWFIVWVIRGTPLLVQIFVIFFGLPSIGIVLKPIPSAIIALVVSQGAYNSEVIRAALTSIPKGQFEACKALGMSKLQTMTEVIIPQGGVGGGALSGQLLHQLAEGYLSGGIHHRAGDTHDFQEHHCRSL